MMSWVFPTPVSPIIWKCWASFRSGIRIIFPSSVVLKPMPFPFAALLKSAGVSMTGPRRTRPYFICRKRFTSLGIAKKSIPARHTPPSIKLT